MGTPNNSGKAAEKIVLEPNATSRKARSSLFADKQPTVYAVPASQETTQVGNIIVSYAQPKSTGTIQVMVPTPSPALDQVRAMTSAAAAAPTMLAGTGPAPQTAPRSIIIVPAPAPTAQVSMKQASGPAATIVQPSNIIIGSPQAGGELTGSQQIVLSTPSTNTGATPSINNIADSAIPQALPAAQFQNDPFSQRGIPYSQPLVDLQHAPLIPGGTVVIDPIPGSMPASIEQLGRFKPSAGFVPGQNAGLPNIMPDWTPDWMKPKKPSNPYRPGGISPVPSNSFIPGMSPAPSYPFMPNPVAGNTFPGMMPVPSSGMMPAPSPGMMPALNFPGAMPNIIPMSPPITMSDPMATGMGQGGMFGTGPGGMVGAFPTNSIGIPNLIPPPHAFGGDDMMGGMMPGIGGGNGKALRKALRGLAGLLPQTHMTSAAEEEDGSNSDSEEDYGDISASDSDSSSEAAWHGHLQESIDKLTKIVGGGPANQKKGPLNGMDWIKARSIISDIGPKLLMGDLEARRKKHEAKMNEKP